MDEACGAYWGKGNVNWFFLGGGMKGGYHLEDLAIDGKKVRIKTS